MPSSFSASTTYNFTTWQEPYPDLTIAFWGDLGVQNDVSQPYLVKDLQQGGFDMIIHVGDFAYNLEDDNGHRGDAFMNEVQPLAAYVPYQTCVSCVGDRERG